VALQLGDLHLSERPAYIQVPRSAQPAADEGRGRPLRALDWFGRGGPW
jgi:hypothetical protein